MAEILVRNEALDINKRFELACFYCFDFEARALWEQMILLGKEIYFCRRNLMKSIQNPVRLYWTLHMQKKRFKDSKKETLESFKYAVKNGHLSATKFFFGQLKLEQKTRMITNSFSYHLPVTFYNGSSIWELFANNQLDIAYFLFSQLRSNYRGNLNKGIRLVLRYFLEWPLQKHFLAIVNLLMLYPRYWYWKSAFRYLLCQIMEKDLRDFKDHDYKELFKEFWKQSPEEFKLHVNTDTALGLELFQRFAEKRFGFNFWNHAFDIKYRAIILQQTSDETERENGDFLRFLVRERVVTKESVRANLRARPNRELLQLMDLILADNSITP